MEELRVKSLINTQLERNWDGKYFEIIVLFIL